MARDKSRLKRCLARKAAVKSQSAAPETTQPSLNLDKRSTAVPCELDSDVLSVSKDLKLLKNGKITVFVSEYCHTPSRTAQRLLISFRKRIYSTEVKKHKR